MIIRGPKIKFAKSYESAYAKEDHRKNNYSEHYKN